MERGVKKRSSVDPAAAGWDLRVAWSTGGGAGAGGAELRQSTEEQVDVLEKRNRWKRGTTFLAVLRFPPPAWKGLYSLLLASHSVLSTPGGNAARAVTSVCVIRWLTCCCCRYGRSSRLLLIPLSGKTSTGG